MTRRPALLAAAFALAAVAAAQEPPVKPAAEGVEGTWEGPLKVGPIELRLAFKVRKAADGKLTATMDSIDQEAKDIPCDEVSFADRKLTVTLKKPGIKFTGRLADDGGSIKGTFEQAGQKFPLELKRVEKLSTLRRPQTPKKPFPYRDEDVTFENPKAKVKLAGTLTTPKGDGPFPAVVLVTGSGPQDRDETLFGHKPFAVIADNLTRRGVAVLRYDDRGVGKSGGKFAGCTSADFAEDAHAALTFLKGRKEIDPKRIGILGHSEGGMIAPMVAAGHPDDVAFIVLLAGPGIPGDEILATQYEAIVKASGGSADEIKVGRGLQRAAIAVIRQGGPADGRKEALRGAIKEYLGTLTDEQRKKLGEETAEVESAAAARFGDPWIAYFIRYDPRPVLAKVRCPVLAVNGGLDLQVLPKGNLAGIEKALAAGGNRDVTVKEFPGLNHLFQPAKTGLMNEYGQVEQTIAPEVLELVGDWIAKRK